MSYPYVIEEVTKVTRHYNPNYGDHRMCDCGHTYHRHFDSHDNMRDVGCKYCACDTFEEDPENNKCIEISGDILEESDYDPGLLNTYGGGNEDWWLDYIRSLINDCNEYWRTLLDNHTVVK